MIIGIDANEANVEKKVGVSVHTYKLLSYFQKKAHSDLKFIVFLKTPPLASLPKKNNYYKYKVIKNRVFWTQISLPIHLYSRMFKTEKLNLFFSPAHYAPRFSPFPTIVAVHDLSYYYYPHEFLKKDLYKLKNWTKYSVEKAKKVIAVSKTTKKDLIKFYSLSDNKIAVIYNGYEKKIKNLKQKNKNLFKKFKDYQYFLFVGTLQPRKNITTLIKAFHQFKQVFPGKKLVIAGKKGWLYNQIFDLVDRLKLKNDVFFTQYIPDQELIYLYQHAFAFIHPSLYEGFGIPILEAMSYGCPVISSFSSSLPEIGSNACLYFDPNSVDDLVKKMTELQQNNQLRKELIDLGKQRVKEFSWEKCGQQTLEVLKN